MTSNLRALSLSPILGAEIMYRQNLGEKTSSLVVVVAPLKTIGNSVACLFAYVNHPLPHGWGEIANSQFPPLGGKEKNGMFYPGCGCLKDWFLLTA